MQRRSTQPQRSYTHADITKFAEQEILTPYSNSSYKVRDIHYLSETTQPIWLIRYDCFYDGNWVGQSTLVVIEHNEDPAHIWLNVARSYKIPAGLRTVGDEDAEIARAEQAK